MAIKQKEIEIEEVSDDSCEEEEEEVEEETNGWTSLMTACRDGDESQVKALIKSGSIINEKGSKDGSSPLHVASNLEIVEILCKEGKKVFPKLNNYYRKDNEGMTPLHRHCREGGIEIVKYLIGIGASIDEVDNAGWNPLMEASNEGRTDVVKYLIETGADVSHRGIQNETPLHLAGNIEIIKLLCEKDKKLNKNIHLMKDNDKKLPLHCVVNVAAAKYLIDIGSPINEIDIDKKTLLMIASSDGNSEMVKYLLEKGALICSDKTHEPSPLFVASNIEVAKLLCEEAEKSKLDLHLMKNSKGDIPLHLHSLNGREEIVKYLVEIGSPIDETGSDGFTSLMFASEQGHTMIVKYLLDKGANISHQSANHKTPLHVADNTEIAQLLCEEAKKLNKDLHLTKDEDGDTPLHNQCLNGKRDTVVKYLIEDIGAPMEEVNNDGVTPLLYASEQGNTTIVKYLLGKGANINHQSKLGNTALHLSIKQKKEKTTRLLIGTTQVNPNLQNVSNGDTAALLALRWKHDIFALILRLDPNVSLHLENKRGDSLFSYAISKKQNNSLELMINYIKLMGITAKMKKEYNSSINVEDGIIKELQTQLTKAKRRKDLLQTCTSKLDAILKRKSTDITLDTEDLFCPITGEIMEDPVMAADGHTYEREAIQKWFQQGKLTSPKTNERLTTQHLFPNHHLRATIADYKKSL